MGSSCSRILYDRTTASCSIDLVAGKSRSVTPAVSSVAAAPERDGAAALAATASAVTVIAALLQDLGHAAAAAAGLVVAAAAAAGLVAAATAAAGLVTAATCSCIAAGVVTVPAASVHNDIAGRHLLLVAANAPTGLMGFAGLSVSKRAKACFPSPLSRQLLVTPAGPAAQSLAGKVGAWKLVAVPVGAGCAAAAAAGDGGDGGDDDAAGGNSGSAAAAVATAAPVVVVVVVVVVVGGGGGGGE